MNPETVAYVIGAGWLGGRVINVLLETTASTLYSVQQAKRQMQIRARTNPKLPLISVVVTTHNDEMTIQQCLESILAANYNKIQIIAIDEGSKDKTLDILKQFKKKHPKQKIQIISQQESVKPTLLGEYVLHIRGRHMVDKNLFNNAVSHFSQGDINTLVPAVRTLPQKSLLSLVQQYDCLRLSVANAAGTVPVAPYAISRIKPLKKAHRPYYADDVLLNTDPLPSYFSLMRHKIQTQLNNVQAQDIKSQLSLPGRLMRQFSGAVLFLEPLLIGYFIYLAVKFQRTDALGLAWGLVVFSLIFYVWSDRHSRFVQKLRLLFLAPMISSLVYILSLTRLLVPVRYVAINAREDWAKWPAPVA